MADRYRLRTMSGKETFAELAYNTIRRRIFEGTYPLGSTIPRRELAKELGMSIVPVYEALARLESEYLVQNIPRSGTRIRVPTPQDLRGFFAVREGLETQAARLFVQTAREADREQLKQAAKSVDTAQQNLSKSVEPKLESLYQWRLIHMELHRHIAEVPRLPMLTEAVERNQLLVFNWYYDQLYVGLRNPPDWHQQLALALCSDSEERADQAMRFHLETRLDELLRSLDHLLVFDRTEIMRGKRAAPIGGE